MIYLNLISLFWLPYILVNALNYLVTHQASHQYSLFSISQF